MSGKNRVIVSSFHEQNPKRVTTLPISMSLCFKRTNGEDKFCGFFSTHQNNVSDIIISGKKISSYIVSVSQLPLKLYTSMDKVLMVINSKVIQFQ